jgi:hypothetical protein
VVPRVYGLQSKQSGPLRLDPDNVVGAGDYYERKYWSLESAVSSVAKGASARVVPTRSTPVLLADLVAILSRWGYLYKLNALDPSIA